MPARRRVPAAASPPMPAPTIAMVGFCWVILLAKQVYHSSFQTRYSMDERAMASLPTNEYLEIREGGYYLTGTRVGLDVLAHDFRAGKSPEAILQAYPSIGSLAKVYGAIT